MSGELYHTQGIIRNPLENANSVHRQVENGPFHHMELATPFVSKKTTGPSLQQRNLQVDQGFQEPLRSQAFQGGPAE